MHQECDCCMCRFAVRREIETVYERERAWLGMFQVRSRLTVQVNDSLPWPSWKIYLAAWTEMLAQGLLIESFSPKDDKFPRYLLTRLMNRGGA